jgi:tetratricopeptide (TPR) repeat protein
VTHWDKKKWYFRYARAYREKKQYISAEMMYVRILDRFKNDRAAGLEYAEMLRTDLRYFAKAEQVIRRRILDNYVNDPEGLLLLGDNYLDWAEEDESKYEAARKTYATLIELYGDKDAYLARMMRYFIRTDQLAEVLPLKDHFMKRRAKIGASDLVELSGYFLEKRYNPGPGDSQALIDRIEDVRKLLERAVKADESSPEANYNIGRFFIYNYKNDLAAKALNESLRLFESASTMSPKRIFIRVDACRLLGEILAQNQEYLKAQELYGEGITLYEEQRANRTVRQDRRVGVLYADYADIDYFITGDLSSAFRNYEKALNELNDTPSVRYRMGYIQYRNEDYEGAMNSFIKVHADVSDDQNLLYGFGNALFRRGDFFAAEGYYDRLMERLEDERLRMGIVFPQARVDEGQFVELYMRTANNLAVALNRTAMRTGDSRKNARALSLLSESVRAWDALTRNPETMIRAQGTNLAFLNIQNMTHPASFYQSEIYPDIPKTLEKEKILQ